MRRLGGHSMEGPMHKYMSIYIVLIIYIWNIEMELYMFIHLAQLENKKLACHHFLFRYLAIHDRRSILIS